MATDAGFKDAVARKVFGKSITIRSAAQKPSVEPTEAPSVIERVKRAVRKVTKRK